MVLQPSLRNLLEHVMCARKRKRYLTRGPNCPMAWVVLETIQRAYMKQVRETGIL